MSETDTAPVRLPEFVRWANGRSSRTDTPPEKFLCLVCLTPMEATPFVRSLYTEMRERGVILCPHCPPDFTVKPFPIERTR